jgi:membrane-associated phospholipid phosphatase
MKNYFKDGTSSFNQVIRLIIWGIIIISFVYAVILDSRLLAFLVVGLLALEVFIQGVKMGVEKVFGRNFITSRPKGAKDCGAFIDCNNKKDDSMGMPSGHSMSIAFFVTFLILGSYSKKRYINYIIGILLIILVMSQRWWVGCHSLLQVIVGASIGIFLGWSYYKIIKMNKWLPEGRNTPLISK